MIQSLEVKGLNKRLDGEFEFNEDLNIFTGANGSGKTTLLKLLWYLISGHLEQILVEIPFRSIAIQTDLFALSMVRAKSNQITLDSSFGKKEGVYEFIVIDAETGRIAKKDVDWVNALEKRIARATKQSLFFPTFRRIEGGFSRVTTDTDNSAIRFLASTPEMLQASISEFSNEVSINEHKFIASISTEDLRELLTQKYADIYEEISTRQSQVLDEISSEMQNNPDKNKLSEITQEPLAVLNAIQKVNEEREQLSKPFSVLSKLSRKILRYDAIHVTGRVVRGETTDGITLGKGKDGITVGEAKDAISSDKLSSGEKQILSFLCYNAFYNNTPIFIDEPELSLHIDWQRFLLPTLLDQSTGNQFFIATHSPFIFSGYQHKEIPLKSD
ncbi:AAA family ATPase [Candidatus Poribacteria bacterium]|nr:AAA family ATPase [Candidatus Poribacteria bacterium]MYK92399.1 AAA family ATPase [Candidatus Poribacteria bacterium]